MKQITKKVLGKNKWIVFPDYDGYEFNLYKTLTDAKNRSGLCVGDGLHRVRGGYEEYGEGHGVWYFRIADIPDKELDQWVEQNIQGRLDSLGEHIDWLMYDGKDSGMSQMYHHRGDGYTVGGDDLQLYKDGERVEGVETTINWGGLK